MGVLVGVLVRILVGVLVRIPMGVPMGVLVGVVGCTAGGGVVKGSQGGVAGGLERIDLALDGRDVLHLLVHAHVAEEVKGLDLPFRAPRGSHNTGEGLEHNSVGEEHAGEHEALAVGFLECVEQLRVSILPQQDVSHVVQRLP